MEDNSAYYAGIDKYLEQVNNAKSVTAKNLEYLIAKIQAKTGASALEAELITAAFFQELRNLMLRGDLIILFELGKFFISSPKQSKNKKKIFPKFKLGDKFIKKINDNRV